MGKLSTLDFWKQPLQLCLVFFLLQISTQTAFSQTSGITSPKRTNIFIRHSVQKGETFETMAQLYNISAETLSAYNNIENYEGPVMALYLSIPLTRQNFTKHIVEKDRQNLVPVFSIKGKKEHVILVNKNNSSAKGQGPYTWSNELPGNTPVIKKNHIDGYLRITPKAAYFFKPIAEFHISDIKKTDNKIFLKKLPFAPPESVVVAPVEPQVSNTKIITELQPKNHPDTLSLPSSTPGQVSSSGIPKDRVLNIAAVKSVAPGKKKVIGINRQVVRNNSDRKLSGYIIILLFCNLGLLLFILTFLFLKRRLTASKKVAGEIIRQIIIQKVLEGEARADDIQNKKEQFFLKNNFRNSTIKQLLVDEIVKAKKSFKGRASQNMILIYEQYRLNEFSLNKLKDRSWSRKVDGIKEIAMMEQQTMLPEIIKMTAHTNDYVRIEAQCALIQFAGYEGLSFLDDVRYPLTEWQQIRLIDQLSKIEPVVSVDFFRWLYSPNHSIVILFLRAIASSRFMSMHQWITILLKHLSEPVRIEAIACLKEIANNHTPLILQNAFRHETKNCQISILKALGEIGNEDQQEFLTDELLNEDDDIKMAAARALVKCMDNGFFILHNYCHDKGHPYDKIFSQIKEGLQV